MRLLLLLLAASAQASVLYQQKATQLCAGQPEFKRDFEARSEGPVEVEITGIHGVTRAQHGEARVWLDDALLGPLRREHGTDWLSPRSVTLSAGTHHLNIECGDEPFSFENLTVRDLNFAVRVPVAAGPAPPPAPQDPCASLKTNRDWPGDPKRAIVLSVLSGRDSKSGLLAKLKRGEQVKWWFKLLPGPGVQGIEYPPIELSENRSDKGEWALGFKVDSEQMKVALAKKLKGLHYSPKGYKPGKWNALKLSLCPDGRFKLSLGNGEVSGELKVDDPEMPLEIRASDIEIQIKGER